MRLLRVDTDFKFFLVGVLLIMLIFGGMLWGPGSIEEWSVAVLFLFLYFMWLGVRGKYYYILGIIASIAVVLGYALSIDRDDWGLASFSAGVIALCSVWVVIYYMYRQKRYVEKELKDKMRLDAVFENATEGILMVDQSGYIIMVNEYAEKLFGYERSELIGGKIEKLIPSKFASQHVEHRHDYNLDPHNRPMGINLELFALHKKQHEFPVEISLGYFKTAEEVFVIAFMNDITERKKASELLNKERERTQKLNQELEQRVAERTHELKKAVKKQKETNESLRLMEMDLLKALEKERELGELKSQFVTTASHEFRTPLSTILSSAFLLENHSGEKYEQAKIIHLQRIKRSVSNMTSILNDFLSLSKMEEGKIDMTYVNVDIQACISEIIDEMDPVKKQKQVLLYSHSGIANTLFFDETILRNILINLISNAIKFSGNADEITITSRMTQNELILQVTDLGIGISDEEQKHLFNRFFRAKNVQNINGTGLGLYIVKRYLDMMNGSISFVSKQQVGTTFTVRIPVVDSKARGTEHTNTA